MYRSVYCINGKVCDAEMFAKFAILRNSQTFPAVYFVMSSKAQFYPSIDFGDSQSFPQAKRLEMQIRKLINTRKYPLIQHVTKGYFFRFKKIKMYQYELFGRNTNCTFLQWKL